MIDHIVRAKLPSSEENHSVRAKILKYNMCWEDHLSSPNNNCYKNGKCQYGYPKCLQRTTALAECGRVMYRHRKEEDKMVISYSPFLTDLMDCHVDIGVTLTVSIFMYVWKYLFQCPDSTQYTIIDPRKDHLDEIQDFINAHYVSASEAAWRIFGFDITRKFPTVSSLRVDLPGQKFFQCLDETDLQLLQLKFWQISHVQTFLSLPP